MNKSIIAVVLATLFPLRVFAAQQPLQTRANTTSPSVDTNFSRQQLMNTEIYTTKADKAQVVRYWADHADGTTIDAKTLVAYDGKIYTTLQAFDKVSSSATPDILTTYFKVAGVTNYSELDGKPTLGTAAALDAGAEPGNVVRLDSSGKIPAFDGSQITGISGTIPSGSTTGQTIEWDAANNVWTPVDWNTLSADGNSLAISSGVLSIAGSSSSENSTVLGRNSLGVFGFNPISDFVNTSGLIPITQEADPTASDADGIYVATISGKVFIKSSSGLASWPVTISPWDTTPNQWTFTAQTQVALSTSVSSNEVIVAGINSASPISSSGAPGCGYIKNNYPCSGVAGTINLGDTVKACVTSSSSPSTLVTCTLESNGMVAPFLVTTADATSTWAIEDNFNENTISNYTRMSGTATVAINTQDSYAYNSTGGGTSAWMQHTTNLGSANQVVQASITDSAGIPSAASSGILLRSNGVTGHGMYVDIGALSHRFVFSALGGSGTTSYLDYPVGLWADGATHLVQVTVKADNTYCVETDWNDDSDFNDTSEVIGCTAANSSYSGTYVGFGFRATNSTERVDNFKAKVYVP